MYNKSNQLTLGWEKLMKTGMMSYL